MSKIYSGGCACGAVQYQIEGAPLFQNHCQCLDCQKRSGTGHGSYLTFAGRDQAHMTGALTQWSILADSGNRKQHNFCPICGTPVFLAFEAMPDLIAIHASSLDDPSLFQPQALTYAVRGHAWDAIDPAMRRFDRMAG